MADDHISHSRASNLLSCHHMELSMPVTMATATWMLPHVAFIFGWIFPLLLITFPNNHPYQLTRRNKSRDLHTPPPPPDPVNPIRAARVPSSLSNTLSRQLYVCFALDPSFILSFYQRRLLLRGKRILFVIGGHSKPSVWSLLIVAVPSLTSCHRPSL